ncbi:MAG TPA: efflux RND transporter permease subunit [Thermoanaerobaculia bacterium]
MIRRAIERPVSTLLGALTVVVLGVFSLLRLPVSLLPALERPGLEITATGPGSAREEMLERVTRPLEQRLGAIPGVSSVRTSTGDGFARVRVESEWQTDPDRLRIEAERRLAGIEAPGVSLAVELVAGDAEPIVEVAIFGGMGGSGAARTAFTREVLVPELARLEGAGRVETLGLAPLHAVVRPRVAALAARGLTPADLVARLKPVGTAVAAGRARAGAAVRPLLAREDAASLDALRALRLPGPRGESVLGDVAGVSLEEVRDESFFRLDGREGTLVRVFRAPEANAVALATRVRERAAELDRRAAAGLRVQVVADRSQEVVAALREMGIAALIGLALGVAVLRVLLGRWRPTLALAVSVPASMLATFSAFHLCGVPLDVVSLAGLALASGMLVDSSIVVLEAIETARARGESEPEPPEVTGTRQIALPVIAGFLTTAVVFLPLVYLQGLARAFFGAQAFAIVASLAASLLFSLTVTPVLARDRRARSGRGRSPGRATYLRLLDGALARPAVPISGALAATAVALLAVAALPRELVPDAATRDLVVRYRLAPDLAPEAARRLGTAVEARTAAALAGARNERLAVQLPASETAASDTRESGRIDLRFGDPRGAASARKRLHSALARLPDVEAWVEPRPSTFVEAIEKAGRRLEVVASAATPERAEALARRVADRLRSAAGLREADLRRDRGRQALLLSWDVPRLAALGADRDRLEEQVREALGDQNAGRARIEGTEPDIVVRPTGQEDPALLPVAVKAGALVPLGALARLDAGTRPPALEREDGLPAVRLAFDQGGAGDPETLLRGVARAADERAAPGGQALELRRAFGQLRLALALSLLLVFLTVAALYESLATPLVVMTTVPVALGGALGLLAITGQTLNVLSFLGLILLAGIVVNNAIVLVHRIEDHLRAGAALDVAVRRAGEERYRPILMTTLATVAGMLPLALLGGEGVELRRSLALAVIGGMSLSAFASLLLVPVLYRLAKYRWTRRAR